MLLSKMRMLSSVTIYISEKRKCKVNFRRNLLQRNILLSQLVWHTLYFSHEVSKLLLFGAREYQQYVPQIFQQRASIHKNYSMQHGPIHSHSEKPSIHFIPLLLCNAIFWAAEIREWKVR